MPFKVIEELERYLEAIDEQYDEGSTIVKGADMFIKTNRKIFNKVKRIKSGKGTKSVVKKVVGY